jgi:hypothetical protein
MKINLVELLDDLATEVMEGIYPSDELYTYNRKECVYTFKKKYQSVYNDWYDRFYKILETRGLKQ